MTVSVRLRKLTNQERTDLLETRGGTTNACPISVGQAINIQDVHVQVIYSLASVFPTIDDQTIAILQALLFRNLARSEHHVAQQFLIFVLGLVDKFPVYTC